MKYAFDARVEVEADNEKEAEALVIAKMTELKRRSDECGDKLSLHVIVLKGMRK